MSISTESERFNSFTIKQPKSYNWEPEKDITTYELALCVPIFTTSTQCFDIQEHIEALPKEAQRHFKETK